jgi:hypothetical protein
METTYPSPAEPCSAPKNQPPQAGISAKSWLRRGSRLAALAVSSALLAMTMTSQAQQIYLDNFTNPNDATNWAVLFGYTLTDANASDSNNLVVVGFDYTKLGLPIAPHSTEFGSASSHRGLKISACYTNRPTELNGHQVTGLSACPTNFSVSQNFVMHADMWINVDCNPFSVVDTNYLVDSTASLANGDAANSTASTVLYGCGYGTAGTKATIPGDSDAIWCGTLTDNGTTAMARMYSTSQTGSYQDGVYQNSGTAIPQFPGDPLVYNIGNGLAGTGNGGGGRNLIGSAGNPPYTRAQLSTNIATGQLWCNIFPPTQVPVAEEILYPQQTNNLSMPGIPTFAWHDVSVEKVGQVIIYKIDGNILATGNYASAGTPAGSFLTFVASRTSTGVASTTSPTAAFYTNLNYAIFANIVVSNYNNVVNVSASTSTCQEGVAGAPGVFDISRPSSGVPLTVTYTLTGSATNGVQYQTTPTTVTFASTATDTNVYITPIDDGIPNPTTTVVLTLQSGAGYVGAGSAVVDILDGDTPTIDITGNSQAYGRYTNTVPTTGDNSDFSSFTLTRRGKLTTGADLSVNLAFSGSAVSGTDFASLPSVTIPDGMASAAGQLVPVDNLSVTTNRTVGISVASGVNYAIGNGTATGTIVSAHYPAPLALLLSDDLTNSDDATNWSVLYGCGDPTNDATDFEANFGMNLSSAAGFVSIAPPPNGNGYALHLTCNKDVTPGSPGAVNAYYTNIFLSGDYAVRFNMNIVEGQTTGDSTEGPVFGINHTGTCSNWWYGSGSGFGGPWASDGIWYFVCAQAGGASPGDYQEFTGAGGVVGGVVTNTGWTRISTNSQASFTQVFKDNPGPFTTFDANDAQTAGIPANGSPALGYDASTWSDVEIKQQGGVVTLSINHTPIFTYVNTTAWTNGYLMLGYADPYGASIGNPEAGVYYANLQVVTLPSVAPSVITISNIVVSGGNVVIKFTTSNASDTTSSFTLRGSGTVKGTYIDVSPAANITSLGSNQFQATTAYTAGGTQFYRIHHN